MLISSRNDFGKRTLYCLCMNVVLLMAFFKWFIEGVLEQPLIELAIVGGVAIALLYANKMKLKRVGMIWCFYIVNVLFSMLFFASGLRAWGRSLVTILIIFIVFLVDDDIKNYISVCRLMIIIGMISGFSVILHYLKPSFFLTYYYPFLKMSAKASFDLYARSGYFFGFLYSPHEAAGLIAFALAGVVLALIISKRDRIFIYAVILFLTVSLLLTGKKGIFAITFLTLYVLYCIVEISKGKWKKIFAITFFAVGVIVSFVFLIIKNPDIPLFGRFSAFFQKILTGNGIDSQRMYLYELAYKEWSQNKLFGIGWRNFNALTVEKYNMSQYHEVNCDYLQWLCETGIIGFILCIIPVVVMLRRTLYVCTHITNRVKSIEERWIALFSAFVQIFTVIYAFIEIPFVDIVFFVIYILSCVIQNSFYRRRGNFE